MIDTLRTFDAGNGTTGFYYSLPALEEKGLGKISRLPVSIRIVLESVLRNCDGKKVAREGRGNSGQLERQDARPGGDSFRRRPHRAPGFHRRSAAGGSGRDALRGGQLEAAIPR